MLASNFAVNDEFFKYMPNTFNSNFEFDDVTRREIKNVVDSLKNSSPGIDNIPMLIFKYNIDSLADIMSYICNLSFAQGIFPEQLGTAVVSCLHKKDDWTILENYRAISLLVSFGKILEKCATIQLINYFMSNNLITPAQFGFIPGKSTVYALQRKVDNIYSAFDDGMVSVGICLNLTKELDSLDRRILCRKLEFCGVTGQSLAWFHSYLARRKQHVRYRNILSEASNNNYGVPQGGCNSAFLFLIFINDICNATERANFVLYADDTNMFVNSRSAEDAMRIARDSLDAVYKWFCDNRLTLNISKSSFVIYHRKGRRMHGENFSLEINNVNLERVKRVKFLGVILDDHLSWEHHVNGVTSRISKLIPLIYQVRDNLSSISLRQNIFCSNVPLFNVLYCCLGEL